MNDTDTDRVILEGLDFAPPCMARGDDGNEARWFACCSMRCCGHIEERLYCDSHKNDLHAWLNKPRGTARTRCIRCGYVFAAKTNADCWRIDRIEPL